MDPESQLAIHGGSPLFPEGPPRWPPESPAVREALHAVYANGDWGRYEGSHCAKLSEQLAAYLAATHVQLCCSGTFAVELALRALPVAPGEEVILAGYDFPGNFRAIEDVGAFPVLVDLTSDSWTIDPQAVEAAIGPRTRAVIVSHLHGSLADMPRLRQMADRHGIGLIDDACQCPGALIAGRQAGTWGDVGVWSFGGSKLLTAGRGGALFTSRPELAQRAKVFCERGNNAFPLSELQAAVLIPQLAMLDQCNAQRAEAVATLGQSLKDGNCPITLPARPTGQQTQSAYYKLGMWYDRQLEGGMSIDSFAGAIRAEGVALDQGFRGFVRRPASRCRKVGELNNSRRAAAETLILHHPVLLSGTEATAKVAHAIEKVCKYG